MQWYCQLHNFVHDEWQEREIVFLIGDYLHSVDIEFYAILHTESGLPPSG